MKGTRPVLFANQAKPIETPVYQRGLLAPDHLFSGPAIVEDRESTTVVPPGAQFRLADQMLVIALKG